MDFYLDFTNKKSEDIVSISHFDFKAKLNLILIVGPMGSGKTEYAAKIYKDSFIIKKKSIKALNDLLKEDRNRANVLFVRNILDKVRFKNYPENIIPYRGGVGSDKINEIGFAGNSIDIANLIKKYINHGTFIIDEGHFYDESLVFTLNKISLNENILFILPILRFNFRKELFNNTVKLLLEYSDKIYNLGAYCEHIDCVEEAFFSYRYYYYNNKEIPAPYFDPLLIVGGDEDHDSAIYPNYATRCLKHHYLAGKEYFYLYLKPSAFLYSQGDKESLENEIISIIKDIKTSNFAKSLINETTSELDINNLRYENILNILELPFLIERMLITLFEEYNLLSKDDFKELILKFFLNQNYISKILISKKYKEFFNT